MVTSPTAEALRRMNNYNYIGILTGKSREQKLQE